VRSSPDSAVVRISGQEDCVIQATVGHRELLDTS
jgi:hypothetical protein